MSKQTVELLEFFDSGPFEDDEAARAADDIFAMLDVEESLRT